MIHKAKNLSSEQRIAIEALIGRDDLFNEALRSTRPNLPSVTLRILCDVNVR